MTCRWVLRSVAVTVAVNTMARRWQPDSSTSRPFPLYLQELTYGERALINYDLSAGYPNHKVAGPKLLELFGLIRNQLA